jgi:hypothetical protein
MLTENGWPMIEANEFGEVINVPDSDLVNAIAMHAYSHGERMYRALVDSIQHNTLFPRSGYSNVAKVEIAGMRPIPPAAFTVGWQIPLAVQVTFPPFEFEQGS